MTVCPLGSEKKKRDGRAVKGLFYVHRCIAHMHSCFLMTKNKRRNIAVHYKKSSTIQQFHLWVSAAKKLIYARIEVLLINMR